MLCNNSALEGCLIKVQASQRCMTSFSLLALDLSTPTTAALSHLDSTMQPFQPRPHNAVAMTIGRSSMNIMECMGMGLGQASWNQSWSL